MKHEHKVNIWCDDTFGATGRYFYCSCGKLMRKEP